MYLKDLTLRGFKSFASATRLRFEPGITCIVGPNGSGKSNVVDALSWVMGEQGAKPLRGSSMSDIIFAGSTSRAGLGRAQVDLTIDNSDGKLPISYSEVTISRTMFRSGGSEYAINGQPVRLLDVQELLSDTGMGRQMHAIVGQGQLDRVLTATPEARRAFIDEAAGVAKHRRRKERALRKLEAMDVNLVRVLDLTEEIRGQLRPLARQAKAARAAAGVRARHDYARSRLLASDTLDAHARLVREQGTLEVLRRASGGAEGQIEDLRAMLSGLEREEATVSGRLAQVQERYRDFREVGQKLQGVIDLARERAAGAQRLPLAISPEAVELGGKRAAEASEESDRLAEAAEVAGAEADRAEAVRSRAHADVERARTALYNRQREHEAAKRVYFDHERAVERAQSVLASATEQFERTAALVAEALQRQASLPRPEPLTESGAELGPESGPELGPELGPESGATKDTAASGGAVASAAAATSGASVASLAYDSALARESAARKSLVEAERKERTAAEEASRQVARRDTLRKSIEDPIGELEQGPRKSERQKDTSRRLRGALAARLDVARGWEDAIGALLGSMVNAQILSGGPCDAESGDVSGNAVAVAEQTLLSVATPIAGIVVPGEATTATVSIGAGRTEIGWPAVAVAGAAPDVQAAVLELLDGCWVCEDAAAANSLLSESSADVKRVATRDGLVFTTHTVQSPEVEGTTSLKLRADLVDAEKQAERAAADLARVVATADGARAVLQSASRAREQALETLRQDDAQRAAKAQERARIAALHHAASREIERAEEQKVRASRGVERAQAALDALTSGDGPKQPESAEDALGPLQRDLAEAETALEAAREGATAARMAAHVAKERASAGERQARAFRTQAEQLDADRRRQLERQNKAERVAAEAQEIADAAAGGVRTATEQAEHAQEIRDSLLAVKQSLDQRRVESSERLATLERDRADTRETLLQAEVAFAQFHGTYLHFLEQIRDVVGVQGEGILLEESGPENLEADGLDSHNVTALPSYAATFIEEFSPELPWKTTLEPQGDDEPEDAVTQTPFTRQIALDALRKSERELSRLGVVNPLAVEEYAALKSRQDFLLEQVEDLNRSKADLLALIKEVDTQVKQAFTSAFEDAAEQFERVFERLFPGGKGRLELTDPDDPLATGVEIYARPAGKRVTRLSLLSGGERSLAALAYLISIFLARPSPFYVMDEVEAALDDTNLGRVLSLFEDLREESQLLIITHQKRTMEIADALYGVSMRGGVTAVISHRMD